MRRSSVRVTVGALAVGAMLLCAPPASAVINRVVDDDKAQCPTAPFSSIQAAVDAAAPGDIVVVCDGVYREQVTITKNNLRLRANVVQRATIQAPAGGVPVAIVRIAPAVTGVEVSRFVIEKPSTSGATPAGVQVEAGASVKTMRQNLIRGVDNWGVVVHGSAPDISYNTIRGYGHFGILVVKPPASSATAATMSFNTLVGQPGASAGITVQSGARGTAIDNRVVDNGAFAGIYVDGASPGVVLKYNKVFDNARGIFLADTQGALVSSNRVSGNAGEGIFTNVGGNKFDHNDARSNGGFDCQDTSSGPRTAGTGNTWAANLGLDSMPAGICRP